MYKTKEELEKEWPIGTIIGFEEVTKRFYCADQIIFEKIRDYYGEDVEWVSPHHVVAKRKVYTTVDGYLFDGEYWMPVVRNGRQYDVYVPEVF